MSIDTRRQRRGWGDDRGDAGLWKQASRTIKGGVTLMWKSFAVVCLVTILASSLNAYEGPVSDYPYKKASDFRTLESFKSVADFESSYEEYIEDCLGDTGGGTGGIGCYIGYEMWDREMNIYYNKLMKLLGKKEKELLKNLQLAWIKERDKTFHFDSALLDKKYERENGTMYSLMRAGDADRMMTPIIKQRALLLRDWFNLRREGHVK